MTGTMAHPGANILYLDITGLDEPLGVTDTHPIWSETRQDFVVAGRWEVGEQFRTLTGESATLTKIHPHRGPPEMVFNLEVDAEHVYSVAGSGLLVHNDCSLFDGTAYTDKVLEQMSRGPGELHSFPELVKNFEGDGVVSQIIGGDGVARDMLSIPGSYTSAGGTALDGVFEFIKESDGLINHRYFNPLR